MSKTKPNTSSSTQSTLALMLALMSAQRAE